MQKSIDNLECVSDATPTCVTVEARSSGVVLRITPENAGLERGYFHPGEVAAIRKTGEEMVRSASRVLVEWGAELRDRFDDIDVEFRRDWAALPNRAEEWEALQKAPTSFAHSMWLHQERANLRQALENEREKLERRRIEALVEALRPGLTELPEWALEQVAVQAARKVC